MDATQALRHPDIMPNEDFEAARLTVRLDAIAANYRTYRRLTGPAAVAAVVKADAYGLGADMVAPALVRAGCDSFFVARLAEGVALRSVAPNARIFVLDGAQPDAVPALLTHRLTPVLNSLAEIAAWSALPRRARARHWMRWCMWIPASTGWACRARSCRCWQPKRGRGWRD